MPAFRTIQVLTFGSGHFQNHKGVSANRAGSFDRLIPRHKITFGVVGTAVEGAPPFSLSLNDLAVAPFFGTLYTQSYRLGVLAGWIIGTGHKAAKPPCLYDHGGTTLVTLFVSAVFGFLLRQRPGRFAPRVRRAGQKTPVAAPFDDHG